ncbi:MAG TPA: hypothetical protein DEA80_07850 [Afipia sp.]|nr:hypothetical protein [Afipia sp.]OUX62991.1 MAG: hypothetical protein CBB64_01560 [Afipia sp. TMED4]HBF54005.1 hypothetical protein [Afipia sp.]HBR44825.1 hypothetical protein [Afipia sp.]HCX18311.1 hypothetical protein [Afipia sp.]|tara:strand:- start:10 stop:339 length:330 start_codon:yes stop_codon:yes gene_type:complete
MRNFFELMSREHVVEVCLVNEVVASASRKMLNPARPLELRLWPGTRNLFARVLVINADREQASALLRKNVEGLWTGDAQMRTYFGYSKGLPCIKMALNSQQDAIEFTFL